MTTELLIEYLRNSWWLWLFVICMTSWVIYTYVSDHARLKQLKDKKKELEAELPGLEAKYSEAAKKLEEKIKEKNKFFKGGQK